MGLFPSIGYFFQIRYPADYFFVRAFEEFHDELVQHIGAIFEFLGIHDRVVDFLADFSLHAFKQMLELCPAEFIPDNQEIRPALGKIEKHSRDECEPDLAEMLDSAETSAFRKRVGFYDQAFELRIENEIPVRFEYTLFPFGFRSDEPDFLEPRKFSVQLAGRNFVPLDQFLERVRTLVIEHEKFEKP